METKVTKETIKNRLKELEMTVTEAAMKMNMSRQNFNKHLAADELSAHFIRQFKEDIGLVNKTATITDIKITKVNNYSNAIPVNHEQYSIMEVPFVNQFARAGYMSGYNDVTYIDRLPKVPWMVDKEYKGTYMCFEVKGDSMDDGSRDSYIEGDILLCREIQQQLWATSKLHIRKWDFVIAHKVEGIIVKRIVEHNVEKATIRVHSLNDLYPDYDIQLRHVVKIFNVVKVERKK